MNDSFATGVKCSSTHSWTDHGGSPPVLDLGGVTVGEMIAQLIDVEVAGGVFAGLPAQDAAQDAAQGLVGIVVGTGLNVVSLPAVDPASCLRPAIAMFIPLTRAGWSMSNRPGPPMQMPSL